MAERLDGTHGVEHLSWSRRRSKSTQLRDEMFQARGVFRIDFYGNVKISHCFHYFCALAQAFWRRLLSSEITKMQGRAAYLSCVRQYYCPERSPDTIHCNR